MLRLVVTARLLEVSIPPGEGEEEVVVESGWTILAASP